MQKCKYLDDLGLDIRRYGTNAMSDDDYRTEKWAEERQEYGFDDRETWHLDRMFIEWIYTRVMMYKEHNRIDLNYHKFKYNGKKMTQGEIMDKILELSKQILLDINNGKLFVENSREICDLWKEILSCMWW